ncbi:MAG: AAA family ATPase [Polyangiaceae bacterium]|nr:AAA family ATPase [Polyangiaceae bacterium]
MRCGTCNFDNPDNMRFCGSCGSSLLPKCTQCGFESPAGFRFCGKCGATLTAVPAPQSAPASAPAIVTSVVTESVPSRESVPPESPASVAERRQVTVLFCDLVGSTQLSEQLDAEDLREVVQAYQAVATEQIDRYEGHIAQYLGDGLLVYFGYPRALEDAARRAVLSGLAIVNAIKNLNERLQQKYGRSISVRIGIHTGTGVVGDVGAKGKREQLVIGNTPNVAARLQGLAEPDQIVISSVTNLLTGGYFNSESLGLQTLKGVSTPMEALRVIGERRSDETAVEGAAPHAPFVGRQADLALMRSRFERARESKGQAILLLGDPGIGKSRLLSAFRSEVVAETPWVTCRCSPYAANTAFYPLVEPLAHLIGLGREDDPERRLAQLDAWVGSQPNLTGADHALLASFLSVPWPPNRVKLSLTPQQEREATLKLLTRVVLAQASNGPVVTVVEDLHWIDPSTLAFVHGLLGAVQNHRVLLLLAARPTFTPSWQPAAHIAKIELGKLSDPDAEQIVLRLSGGKPIPRVVLHQILEKCDGVPLFIEELTKAVLESGLLSDTGDRMELAHPFTSP